jgi:hypothetical protein
MSMRHKALLGVAAGMAVLGGAAAVTVQHYDSQPVGALPDRQLTPGQWDSSLTPGYLCTHSSDERRNVSQSTKHRVFASYGIAYPDPEQRSQWEVDHLVSLSLGGTNDVSNLWPQQAPGYHDKDKLEVRLYHLICDGKLDLPTAQRAMATNWKTAYDTYVVTSVPVPANGAKP